MSRLQELRERRAHECRLTPDRALATIDEGEAFLRDRGLLTRTADSALPSLYEACHEDPYAPGRGGFGEWPATKWPWFGEIAERSGVYRVKIRRGKDLLVSDEVAALLDPICRAEIERMRADAPDWALVRWDQAFPEPAEGPGGLEELLVAAVRAAVVAPEREVPRWFSWTWRQREGLVDELVAEGRLERPEPGWVTAPAS